MHLTIVAIGSRGDVQPLIPLARRLLQRGHEVRFATHENFASVIRSFDLDYFPIRGDSSAFYGGAAGRAFRDRMRGDLAAYQRFVENYLGNYTRGIIDDCWSACRNTDAIMTYPWTRVGPTIAEKLGIQSILFSLAPVTYLPTRAFPNPFIGEFRPDGGPEYNLQSWAAAKPMFAVGREQFLRWRGELGLAPLDLEEECASWQNTEHLFCWSENVLPKPEEWPSCAHVTGYWYLDHEPDFEPSAELAKFLDSGPPPVAMGFGSQVETKSGLNSRGLTELVIRAVERSGQRAILVAGFGGLKAADLPKNILTINNVPYSWLLPRVAALVHHGGAGSVSEGLRAGLPGLGIPFGFDQPLWAQRIHDIGVGPAPIPAEHITAEKLCSSMVQLAEDRTMRAKAKALGAALRAEDGVGRAVETIDNVVGVKLSSGEAA